MKKIIIIGCILFQLVTFYGCVIATDFYSGKRPYDYGKAKWVSESPDAWFIVNSSEEDEKFIYPKGEIIFDNRTIKFTISFGHGKEASFTDNNDNVIFLGTCKFSSTKLIISVNKKSDAIFNGKVNEIVFVKKGI